jgi:rod shape-determining protein MreC
VLGIIAAVWLLLPTVVKSLLRISFYEFQAPAELAGSTARDLQSFWSTRVRSRDALFEAGRDQARLFASYELRIQENEHLRNEVARMERLLRLPSHPGFRYEIARVASRDFNAWWQQITIRKGSNHGIEVGCPVIFAGGVVGRVREVHAYTSVVDLISSKNVRLAAFVAGDTRPVSYQGGGDLSFGPARGHAEFIPNDARASSNAPLQLVTSGLGGVFPPGLPIGRLYQVTPGPDGLFQTGLVHLDPRLHSLTEVVVMVAFPEGEQ